MGRDVLSMTVVQKFQFTVVKTFVIFDSVVKVIIPITDESSDSPKH